MIEQITPYKPTHPGEVLHDELKASTSPADFWMRFQSQYELDQARIKEKQTGPE